VLPRNTLLIPDFPVFAIITISRNLANSRIKLVSFYCKRFIYTMVRINTQYLEEIRCKIVPKPERNTKTIIGGGEDYGKRPLFVGHGTGLRKEVFLWEL
jgi:hypothetical protein